MHKNASRHSHRFSSPKLRSGSDLLAPVAHAFQQWRQPKRGSTWKGTKEAPNPKYRKHYSNKGLESRFNPNPPEPKQISKARRIAAKHQTRSGRRHRVYLVKFTPDKAAPFLKIGMTSRTIEERFNLDLSRTRHEVLYQTQELNRPTAFALEQALLEFFRAHRRRPGVVLLSGGNTECFPFSDDLSKKALDLMVSFEHR